MNTNDARLVRVYTEEANAAASAHVGSSAPNATLPPASTFNVVVEGDCGANQCGTLAPYTLTLVLYDITTASNVGAPSPFSQAFGDANWAHVNGASSDCEMRFVTSQNVAGLQNHVLKYTAYLRDTSANIVSFVESEPFILV